VDKIKLYGSSVDCGGGGGGTGSKFCPLAGFVLVALNFFFAAISDLVMICEQLADMLSKPSVKIKSTKKTSGSDCLLHRTTQTVQLSSGHKSVLWSDESVYRLFSKGSRCHEWCLQVHTAILVKPCGDLGLLFLRQGGHIGLNQGHVDRMALWKHFGGMYVIFTQSKAWIASVVPVR
jgi:hypothetical protein